MISLCQQSGAQEPPPEFAGVFVEVLDVRVVNVEVVVTDRKGDRVQSLRRDDFTLLVDGEETSIDYFSEIAAGTVKTSAGAEDSQLPPSLGEGEEVGTNYLVFVDDLFSLSRDRNRVLDNIQEEVGQLSENDRLAMVAFDGRRLTLVTDWTHSESTLDYAFRTARGRPTRGAQRLTDLRTNDFERRQRTALATTTSFFQAQLSGEEGGEQQEQDFNTRLDLVERHYAFQLEDQLTRSVTAAVASLRAFAGQPGRKVALLLSGGWPFDPALYAMASSDAGPDAALAAATEGQVKRGSQIFGDLVNTANLLGYTLYPVDVPGLARRGIDDGLGSPDPLSGEPASGGDGLARDLQQQDSLEYLAYETGGQAFINSARDVAFAKTIEDTRSYYWLGFSPSRNEDNEQHQIEAKLRDRSLQARSRSSFLDFSRQAEQTMIVEAAAFFGQAPSKYPLEIRFGKPVKAGRGKVTVPLEVGIPMENITMIPAQGVFVATLEYWVTVMDENGARSQTPMHDIRIVGEEPPRPGHIHWHETAPTMRKRRHRVVVAVSDPLSGMLLSSTAIVDP